MPSAEALLEEKLQVDLRDGVAFLRTRLRERSREEGGLLRIALPVEAAVLAAVARLELLNRASDDLRFVLDLARRVRGGADAGEVARGNVERAIRKRELSIFVRVKKPAFQEIEAMVVDMMEKRLPDLARMDAVGEAASYFDLARRAFPDRAEAERIVEEQHRYVERIVDTARKNPDLLRLPQSWVPHLVLVAADLVAWSRDRVAREIDEIYGP